jgi:AraC-like DNA-binding protein
MQNRSALTIPHYFNPIRLSKEFPMAIGRNSPNTTPVAFLHRHDCLELGYCHEGAGIFMVEDQILPFHAGDVSVINEQEFHIAQSASDSPSTWSFISLRPVELLHSAGILDIAHLTERRFPNILTPQQQPDITSLVRDLAMEMETRPAGYREVSRGIVLALLAKLHRRSSPVNHPETTRRQESAKRIAPAIEFFLHHYAEPIQLGQVAHACHLSEPHFRRLFRSATGKSPQEYLVHLRINMATILLRDPSRPILDIALAVGYPSLSGFNRHFHRLTGLAPRNWRRQ